MNIPNLVDKSNLPFTKQKWPHKSHIFGVFLRFKNIVKFKAFIIKICENFILFYYTHFEITFYLCGITSSQYYDLFTNFPFFVLNRNISVQNRIKLALYRIALFLFCIGYLTIIPWARMGSESITHEAEGWFTFFWGQNLTNIKLHSRLMHIIRRWHQNGLHLSFLSGRMQLHVA